MKMTKNLILEDVHNRLQQIGFEYSEEYDKYNYKNYYSYTSKLSVHVVSVSPVYIVVRFEAKRDNNQIHGVCALVIDVECYREADMFYTFSKDKLIDTIEYIHSYYTCRNIAL